MNSHCKRTLVHCLILLPVIYAIAMTQSVNVQARLETDSARVVLDSLGQAIAAHLQITLTLTPTATATRSATSAARSTPTSTPAGTLSATKTNVLASTSTPLPSATWTRQSTATSTSTMKLATATPTSSSTPKSTNTPTTTPTNESTPTPTATEEIQVIIPPVTETPTSPAQVPTHIPLDWLHWYTPIAVTKQNPVATATLPNRTATPTATVTLAASRALGTSIVAVPTFLSMAPGSAPSGAFFGPTPALLPTAIGMLLPNQLPSDPSQLEQPEQPLEALQVGVNETDPTYYARRLGILIVVGGSVMGLFAGSILVTFVVIRIGRANR